MSEVTVGRGHSKSLCGPPKGSVSRTEAERRGEVGKGQGQATGYPSAEELGWDGREGVLVTPSPTHLSHPEWP